MYMSLCLLSTLSAMRPDEKINDTIYIENGATSVNLSCGEVPQSAVAIDWFIYKSGEWVKLLKFYHTKSMIRHYSSNKTKYDISESTNTSLVVKNIKLSDSFFFMCGSAGGPILYSYMNTLHVVGKSLFTYLFTSFFYSRRCWYSCEKFKDSKVNKSPKSKRYFNL